MKRILFMTVFFLGCTSMAQARGYLGGMNGVMLTLNGFVYNQTRDSSPGSSTDNNLTIYDVKLGYLDADGLYLGGIYTGRNHSETSLSNEDGNALGASIGYMGDAGFFVMGHYYLSAKLGKYNSGSGYQADFGYMTSVTDAFYVGVELTYRNLEYKKNDDFNIDSYRVKELFPMLTLGFIF